MENSVDFPSPEEIEEIMARAQEMRAEAFRETMVAIWHAPSKLTGGLAKVLRIPRTNLAE